MVKPSHLKKKINKNKNRIKIYKKNMNNNHIELREKSFYGN